MLIRWTLFSLLCASIGVLEIISEDAPNIISNTSWKWQCIKGQCEKLPLDQKGGDSEIMSLSVCKLYCNDFGNMWPQPTGKFVLGDYIVHLNRNSIDILNANTYGSASDLLHASANRFKSHIEKIIPVNSKVNEGGKSMIINIDIKNMEYVDLTLETDESYVLNITSSIDGRVIAIITAENFFGARHGLETLEQFIVFDDIRSELQVANSLFITDKPVYPYRGILLDTARNYFTIASIKRTIDAMAACKMNRFHWHITDSQSFPFYSKSFPRLSQVGAIKPHKIYTPDQIIDIVRYGIERGVKVIPEFDAPAHVGEGWQGTNLTVCFKAEPWNYYCVEPPCGQFDPTIDHLYEVLEGIYSDMFELFKPDIFHMGGDEVKNTCWNSSQSIQSWMLRKGWQLDDQGFFNLWDYFQRNAQEKVFKVNGGKKLPLILWTSTLTKYKHIDKYLSKDDYIIQVWTTGTDPEITGLLNKGYRLILSNYDALYLDCGFSAWVGQGNNWCSPYIGWQKVYDNSPARMAGENKHLILGGEATLWSEQADSASADGRLWPRAGALAERLWAEPNSSVTWRNAERRMLHFRERLIDLGVDADSIEPEWCYQNEGYCYN